MAKTSKKEDQMKGFFSYDENNGFVLHDTAESAKKAATAELETQRDEAIRWGEWYDEALTICWGEVTENISEIPEPEKNCYDYKLSKAAE